MKRLIELVKKYEDAITQVMTAVIILVSAVFIGLLIIKAMKAFNDQSMGEAFKCIAYAVGVALLAWMSISGVRGLFKLIEPDKDLIPNALAGLQHVPIKDAARQILLG